MGYPPEHARAAATAPVSFVRSTLRSLLLPRRVVPVALVTVTMVLLQWRLSWREPLAGPLGILMCLAFVLLGPLSYRMLNPDEPRTTGSAAVRLGLFGLVGLGVVLGVGKVLPTLLSMSPTLMTANSSLLVCWTLFLAGGFGLARDVELSERLAHESARADALAREAEHAQLLAMRAHLDPHFLFNTLGAIAEWCRTDGEVAERAVLRLSTILRAVLAGVKATSWPLERELALARDVLELHLLRDPELFTLEVDDPSKSVAAVRVPPLILLPLVDNAVKHGPARGHRGPIELTVRERDGHVTIRLRNEGPCGPARPGSDGLPTLARRLRLAYGDSAKLSLSPLSARRTEAMLVIPGVLP